MSFWSRPFGGGPKRSKIPPPAPPAAPQSAVLPPPLQSASQPKSSPVDEARALVAIIGSLAQSDFNKNNDTAQKLKGVITDEVLASLMELLKSESCRVRSHAAQALGIIGDNRAIEPLIEFLRKPYKDESISYYSFPAGGRGSAITALQKLGDKRTLPALIEALDDPSWGLRGDATMALCEIGNESATEALAKLVTSPVQNEAKDDVKGSWPRAKIWALNGIEKFGDERAVPALLQAVKSPSAKIRDRAMKALKKFPNVTFDRPDTNCSRNLHWFEHGKCVSCLSLIHI